MASPQKEHGFLTPSVELDGAIVFAHFPREAAVIVFVLKASHYGLDKRPWVDLDKSAVARDFSIGETQLSRGLRNLRKWGVVEANTAGRVRLVKDWERWSWTWRGPSPAQLKAECRRWIAALLSAFGVPTHKRKSEAPALGGCTTPEAPALPKPCTQKAPALLPTIEERGRVGERRENRDNNNKSRRRDDDPFWDEEADAPATPAPRFAVADVEPFQSPDPTTPPPDPTLIHKLADDLTRLLGYVDQFGEPFADTAHLITGDLTNHKAAPYGARLRECARVARANPGIRDKLGYLRGAIRKSGDPKPGAGGEKVANAAAYKPAERIRDDTTPEDRAEALRFINAKLGRSNGHPAKGA